MEREKKEGHINQTVLSEEKEQNAEPSSLLSNANNYDENAYRMVKKAYFCYVCQKEYKKLVQVAELMANGLTCDQCGSGFCEIIDASTDQEGKDMAKAAAKQAQFDEPLEEVKASEGISMLDQLQNNSQNGIRDVEMRDEKDDQDDFRPPQVTVGRKEDMRSTNPNLQNHTRSGINNAPPRVTNQREDFRNTSMQSDAFGRPLPRQAPQQPSQPQGTRQQQQNQEQPNQQRQQRRRNRGPRNPFAGTGDFMNSFFGEDSPFNNAFFRNAMGEQQHSNIFGTNNQGSQPQQQQQQQSSSQRRHRNQDVFDEYFRPFNFTSMFNDSTFQNMSDGMNDFNPHEFGVNYNQNFRSSFNNRRQQRRGGMGLFEQMGLGEQQEGMSFQDFIDSLQEQMQAQQQPDVRRPTSENVVRNLPIVKIEQKHCKKGENGELEMPTCSICMTDFELGKKGMFLPCGHTFCPDCIKPWLKDHNTCPVCRKELPTE